MGTSLHCQGSLVSGLSVAGSTPVAKAIGMAHLALAPLTSWYGHDHNLFMLIYKLTLIWNWNRNERFSTFSSNTFSSVQYRSVWYGMVSCRPHGAGGDAAAAYSRQSRAKSRFFRGVWWWGVLSGGMGGDPAKASYAHRQQRNAAPRWEAP